jgi:hypothetical protein
MKHPTWQEVGLHPHFVNLLRGLRAGPAFDSVIQQVVMRKFYKMQYQYKCGSCRWVELSYRSSEEVAVCASCGGTKMTCTMTMSPAETPTYSRRADIDPVMLKMRENYEAYFKSPPPEWFCNCGWDSNSDMVYCQFVGGDSVLQPLRVIRFAILKAAILCPFLWDTSRTADWEENPAKGIPLGTVLAQLSSDHWR